MKAALYDHYGDADVIRIAELQVPEPRAGEVRVRIIAAAVNPKCALTRAGRFRRMAGPSFPKRLGYDFAGTVDALGTGVSGFAVGEPVYGMVNGWAGGTMAEALCVPVDELAPKPASLDFGEAAALPLAAMTALQALRDLAGLRPGRTVLIHGASGGVGSLAVQIAKAQGAIVTATCGADSADRVRALGADAVLDYRANPPASLGQRFDCVFDVFGNLSFAAMKGRLASRGVYVTTVPNTRNVLDHLRTRLWPGRRARLVVVKSRRRDLETLSRWVAEARLKPIIAARYPLAQLAEAHRAIQTRRTHGKIVIDIATETHA